jgi:hypothetical protein
MLSLKVLKRQYLCVDIDESEDKYGEWSLGSIPAGYID